MALLQILFFSVSTASHSRSRLRMNSTGNTTDGAVVNGPAISAVAVDEEVAVGNAQVDNVEEDAMENPESDELFPELNSDARR